MKIAIGLLVPVVVLAAAGAAVRVPLSIKPRSHPRPRRMSASMVGTTPSRKKACPAANGSRTTIKPSRELRPTNSSLPRRANSRSGGGNPWSPPPKVSYARTQRRARWKIDFAEKRGEYMISEKPDHRFLAWVKVGKVALQAGDNTITFKIHGEIANSGGIDCFLFDNGGFVPSGTLKPVGGAARGAETTAAADEAIWIEGEKPSSADVTSSTAGTTPSRRKACRPAIGCRITIRTRRAPQPTSSRLPRATTTHSGGAAIRWPPKWPTS